MQIRPRGHKPGASPNRAAVRRLRGLSLATVLVGVAVGGAGGAGERPGAPPFSRMFSLVGDFPLGTATDRMDYQSLDPAARRLYIAKIGDGKLLVFDIAQNKLLRQLDGFPKITGVLVVPDLHRVYASVPGAGLVSSLFVGLGMVGMSAGHGAVAVLDTDNLKEIARLPGGVFPDGIAYDPKDDRIFVSDELGSAVLAIDAKTNRVVARIDTGGEVGNVRYDPITSKVYVPIQSRDEIAVIDPAKATLSTRHALGGCLHPHGLALSPDVAIGYVACDANDMLITIDLAMGKVLGWHPVAHDPDVLAIDPGSKRLYVASESGNVSTFDISSANSLTALGDVFVSKGAHSVAVDPTTHRLYFPLANLNGHSVMRVLIPKT